MRRDTVRRDRYGRFQTEDDAEAAAKDAADTLAADIGFAAECYREEVLPAVLDGTYDGPELVVLSSGYAEVYSDGWVVSAGVVLFTLDTL